MAWFRSREPQPDSGEQLPLFLLESRHGIHYGYPASPDGTIKIAKHHHADEAVDPEGADGAMTGADETLIRAALADHIPAANGPLAAAKTCLYTVTPDRDFILDRMSNAPNIVMASPCSGHGFKFAPVTSR